MAAGEKWSPQETAMAFALYKLLGPTPKKTDEDVIALADALGRTVDSVRFKIGNLSALDKNRIALGKKGWENGSKTDKQIWEEYETNPDEFLNAAMDRLTEALNSSPLAIAEYDVVDLPQGETKQRLVNQRVNQNYFRRILMENYSRRCCLTGLAIDALLVASHIKPWSKSTPTERLAASNGLLLNALHDKAFDQGLLTIDESYRVHISPTVKKSETANLWLWDFEGEQIELPKVNAPSKDFIEFHNEEIFLRK